MASKLKIKVNGLVHNVTASLDTPLLYVLHNELHLHGPRFGCGLAQCGACSVLLDGKEIRSCVTPVAAVSGKAITTLEGMPALYAKSRGTTASTPAASASAAAGVDRRAGAALRLLPERNDDPGRRSAGDDEAADRGADPHRDERPSVPLRHVSAHPDGDPEGRRCDGEGWEVTMTEMLKKEFSRKSFVKGGGALIVALQRGRRRHRREGREVGRRDPYASMGPFDQIAVDSWLIIHADNTASVKLGKVEMGQGTPTALLMIAAEELDMDFGQMKMIIARHERHPEPGRQHRQPGRADGRQADPCRGRAPRSRRCSSSPRRTSAFRSRASRSTGASSRAAARPSPTAR